jgi:DNA-binding MarR family transcriptional regulator
MSNATNDLMSLIFNAGQILREKARDKSNFKDCSFLHMHVLHYIKEQKETSMKAMADYLHITPPSATSLVNSLVKKGFVERTTDENDRRTINIKITKIGTGLLKNNFDRIISIVEQGVNKLNEKEKKELINILKKISE